MTVRGTTGLLGSRLYLPCHWSWRCGVQQACWGSGCTYLATDHGGAGHGGLVGVAVVPTLPPIMTVRGTTGLLGSRLYLPCNRSWRFQAQRACWGRGCTYLATDHDRAGHDGLVGVVLDEAVPTLPPIMTVRGTTGLLGSQLYLPCHRSWRCEARRACWGHAWCGCTYLATDHDSAGHDRLVGVALDAVVQVDDVHKVHQLPLVLVDSLHLQAEMHQI